MSYEPVLTKQADDHDYTYTTILYDIMSGWVKQFTYTVFDVQMKFQIILMSSNVYKLLVVKTRLHTIRFRTSHDLKV